jgi:hypothetical protein
MSSPAHAKSEIPRGRSSSSVHRRTKRKKIAPATVPPLPMGTDCVVRVVDRGANIWARGRLVEIKPDVFRLIPTELGDIAAGAVPWQSPEPGSAIETTSPITNSDEADYVLERWAVQTFHEPETLRNRAVSLSDFDRSEIPRIDRTSSSTPLIATGRFATKPLALHPSMLVVNGVSVTSFIARCIVKTEHPSKGSIVGKAGGFILYRDELKTFDVLPLSIDDCFGLWAQWDEPKRGQLISTTVPLENWSAAQAAFRAWAQRAFEDHWHNFTPSPWPRRRPSFLKRLT